MADVVHSRSFEAPPVNMDEVLRYAGAAGAADGELIDLARTCAEMAAPQLSYRVCWRAFPIKMDGEALDLGFARTRSAALRRNLEGCGRVVVFAATVGLGIDRLIERYKALSPARALMLQAVGAERVEALCGAFCRQLSDEAAGEGLCARPRFSPGYGDLPLALQRDIFAALDCPRRIGLTLNDSLLMSPSKSVTAIVGLGRGPGHAAGGCGACARRDCQFRKG